MVFFFKRNFDIIGCFFKIHYMREENLNNCIRFEAQEPFYIFRKCHGVQLIVDIKNKIYFTSEELFFSIILCVLSLFLDCQYFFLLNSKKKKKNAKNNISCHSQLYSLSLLNKIYILGCCLKNNKQFGMNSLI